MEIGLDSHGHKLNQGRDSVKYDPETYFFNEFLPPVCNRGNSGALNRIDKGHQ